MIFPIKDDFSMAEILLYGKIIQDYLNKNQIESIYHLTKAQDNALI